MYLLQVRVLGVHAKLEFLLHKVRVSPVYQGV